MRLTGSAAAQIRLLEIIALRKEGGGPLGFGVLVPKAIQITIRTHTQQLRDLNISFTVRCCDHLIESPTRCDIWLVLQGGGRDDFLKTFQSLLEVSVRQQQEAEQDWTVVDEPEAEESAAEGGRLRRAVIVFENERKPLIFRQANSDRGFSWESLLPTERLRYSDSLGNTRWMDDPGLLPSGWRWEGGWQVRVDDGMTDKDGWSYAWNWSRTWTGGLVEWTPDICDVVGKKSWVRRRKWQRRAVEAVATRPGGADNAFRALMAGKAAID